MITRIELSNFMSHVHTVIEPAAGLTVLVGPNNCGKSAVVAALQILSHNENSTYVLRHGSKECSVKVTTDDGHTIEWRRKKSPSYVVDGQTFDRLKGTALPEELQRALRLPYVDGGGGDGQFDVHFGEQKSPIFLLDKSAATAARFFASSSDAIRLVQMQRRHKDKLARRQQDKNRLEAESRRLNAELEALLPAVDLEVQITRTEQLHGLLLQEAAWLVQAERDQAALAAQQEAVSRHGAQAQTLAPLTQPPEFAPTQPLEILTGGLECAQVEVTRSAARSESLASLPPPPKLDDDSSLADTITRLHVLTAMTDRESAAQHALQVLAQPPVIAETAELATLVDRLTTALQAADAIVARHEVLLGIVSPPQLDDERELADLVSRLAAAETNCARWSEVVGRAAIDPPAPPIDWHSLAECLAQLEKTSNEAERFTSELKAAAVDLAAAESELREFAASELCPTCGSPLDADRLLAGASLASGGHAHD